MVCCPNLVRKFSRAPTSDVVGTGSTKPVSTSRPVLGFLANQASNPRAIPMKYAYSYGIFFIRIVRGFVSLIKGL
jgi:hypothetical protein